MTNMFYCICFIENISTTKDYVITTILLLGIIGIVYMILVLPFLWKYFKEIDNAKKEDFLWDNLEQSKEKELNKQTNEDKDSQQSSVRTLILRIGRLGIPFFLGTSQRI